MYEKETGIYIYRKWDYKLYGCVVGKRDEKKLFGIASRRNNNTKQYKTTKNDCIHEKHYHGWIFT